MQRTNYRGADAVVFVVDSNDRKRIEEARDELKRLIAYDENGARHLPVLVMANKQDLPGAMTVTEVAEKLVLYELRTQQWFIVGSSATTGVGIHEGIEWVVGAIRALRRGTWQPPPAPTETAPAATTPAPASANASATKAASVQDV